MVAQLSAACCNIVKFKTLFSIPKTAKPTFETIAVPALPVTCKRIVRGEKYNPETILAVPKLSNAVAITTGVPLHPFVKSISILPLETDADATLYDDKTVPKIGAATILLANFKTI